MYIIVVGGGEIGYYLARALMDEGHEVLVLDKSAEEVEFMERLFDEILLPDDGPSHDIGVAVEVLRAGVKGKVEA